MVNSPSRRVGSARVGSQPPTVLKWARSHLDYYASNVDTEWQCTARPSPGADFVLHDSERVLVAPVEDEGSIPLGYDSHSVPVSRILTITSASGDVLAVFQVIVNACAESGVELYFNISDIPRAIVGRRKYTIVLTRWRIQYQALKAYCDK